MLILFCLLICLQVIILAVIAAFLLHDNFGDPDEVSAIQTGELPTYHNISLDIFKVNTIGYRAQYACVVLSIYLSI